MAISPVALKAYTAAAKAEPTPHAAPTRSFTETVKESLASVNNLQHEKARMVEEFASGKNQNVHELMISLQKASIAMEMTAAVRNKVMQAYQEVMRMQF